MSHSIFSIAHNIEQQATLSTLLHSNSSQSIEAVDALSSEAAEIKTFVGTIDRIASTTDLLALNAAIEASRSEEHTSELQSLMRISYAVFCLKKKTTQIY